MDLVFFINCLSDLDLVMPFDLDFDLEYDLLLWWSDFYSLLS